LLKVAAGSAFIIFSIQIAIRKRPPAKFLFTEAGQRIDNSVNEKSAVSDQKHNCTCGNGMVQGQKERVSWMLL